jgi:hypothetical protein
MKQAVGGEEKISFETTLSFQQTTWRYIPEDKTLHNHRCENLKSYISASLSSNSVFPYVNIN